MVWARGARCVTVLGGLLGAPEVVFVDAWLPGSPYDTMFSTSEIKIAPIHSLQRHIASHVERGFSQKESNCKKYKKNGLVRPFLIVYERALALYD